MIPQYPMSIITYILFKKFQFIEMFVTEVPENVDKSRIYYINVKLPNLDLKQGISYLERERGKGGRERQR